MSERESLRPQDILIILKVLLLKNTSWRNIDIAKELGLSPAEVGHALKRLNNAGLIDARKRYPLTGALIEFLTHGLKYVFPAKPGRMNTGIPTSHSSPFLNKKIISNSLDQYIWASIKGKVRGQTIKPLYKTVPEIVNQDKDMYEFLALIDAIRVGRTRERNIAIKLIKEKIEKL